mgnify:CR=1 FL=1
MSGYVENGTFFKRNPEWYYYDENDYPHLTKPRRKPLSHMNTGMKYMNCRKRKV